MIFGIHFLSQFSLSISVPQQSLLCEKSGLAIFEYCVSPIRRECNEKSVTSLSNVTTQPAPPCESLEQRVLSNYQDLFPADIPAVSDEEEAAGLFVDSSFPQKIQSKSSRVQHKIVLTNPDALFNEKQYPCPQKHLVAWQTLLDQHVEAGRLRRSTRQYASPSLIIPKKDPTALPRWVCDYRTLNSLTVRDRSPLPNVDKLIQLVATGKVFSILNQTNAFFQMRMREADIPLTAVKTPWGLYEWRVMPMGLTNAPATHQARLEEALGELINDICVVYLDNIVVFSNSFTEHKQHVR
jgi:hypothetical protein